MSKNEQMLFSEDFMDYKREVERFISPGSSFNAEELMDSFPQWFTVRESFAGRGYWVGYSDSLGKLKFLKNEEFLLGSTAIKVFIGENSEDNPIHEIFGRNGADAPLFEVLLFQYDSKIMVPTSNWDEKLHEFLVSEVKFEEKELYHSAASQKSPLIEERKLLRADARCVRYGFESLDEVNLFLEVICEVVEVELEDLKNRETELLERVNLMDNVMDSPDYPLERKSPINGFGEVNKKEWCLEDKKEECTDEYEWKETYNLIARTFAFQVIIGEWTLGRLLQEMLEDNGKDEEAHFVHKVIIKGYISKEARSYGEWRQALDDVTFAKESVVSDFLYAIRRYTTHPMVKGIQKSCNIPEWFFAFENKKEAIEFLGNIKKIILDDHQEFFDKEKELFETK